MNDLEDGWLADELRARKSEEDAWLANAEAQYQEIISAEQNSK